MRLFLAEKPSQARELAKALGKVKKQNGYLEIEGTNDIVTWAFGHILQMKTPEMYDEKYKALNACLFSVRAAN